LGEGSGIPAIVTGSKLFIAFSFHFNSQEEKRLASATISNLAAASLYPAKFLHGEQAPEYLGIKVIKQLRAQVSHVCYAQFNLQFAVSFERVMLQARNKTENATTTDFGNNIFIVINQ